MKGESQMRNWARSWKLQLLLALVAVGVVLAAPLASPNKAAADPVIISGARSLSDQVVVNFDDDDDDDGPRKVRTTDVHLLAFNDLHGNLEAGGLNIYGKFAGGAAYLAKAVKDRQAMYGRRQRRCSQGTTSAPARWRTASSTRSRSRSPPT